MKKLLIVAMVASVGVAGWKWHARSTEPSDLVVNRLWIDHLPTNGRDMVNIFIAIDDEAMGIFQKGSRWAGSYEMFHFEMHDGQLRIAYPQTGKSEQVRVKARSCDEQQMDYCLELDGASRGVKKYYSMEGWDLRSRNDVEPMLQRLVK